MIIFKTAKSGEEITKNTEIIRNCVIRDAIISHGRNIRNKKENKITKFSIHSLRSLIFKKKKYKYENKR